MKIEVSDGGKLKMVFYADEVEVDQNKDGGVSIHLPVEGSGVSVHGDLTATEAGLRDGPGSMGIHQTASVIEELEAERDRLIGERDEAIATNTQVRVELTNAVRFNATHAASIIEKDVKLRAFETALGESEDRGMYLIRERDGWEEKAKRYSDEIRSLNADFKAATGQIASYEQTITRGTAAAREQQETIDRKNEEIGILIDRRSELIEESNEKRDQLASYESTIRSLTAAAQEQERAKNAAILDLQQRDGQIDRQEQKINDFRVEIAALQDDNKRLRRMLADADARFKEIADGLGKASELGKINDGAGGSLDVIA